LDPYSIFIQKIWPENKVLLIFQVVLPFVEKYFAAHREYFVGSSSTAGGCALASVKEKEMTAK
jgi:hypothetical protein